MKGSKRFLKGENIYTVDINLFREALKECGISMSAACRMMNHPRNYFYIRFNRFGYIRERTAKEIENKLGIPISLYGKLVYISQNLVEIPELASVLGVSEKTALLIGKLAQADVKIPSTTPRWFLMFDVEKVKDYIRSSEKRRI